MVWTFQYLFVSFRYLLVKYVFRHLAQDESCVRYRWVTLWAIRLQVSLLGAREPSLNDVRD